MNIIIEKNGFDVFLSNYIQSDYLELYKIANEEDILKSMNRDSFSIDDAIKFIIYARDMLEREKEFHLAIRNKENKLVGAIGLVINNDRSAEIGLWIGKEYRRRGYAHEAIELMLCFAFNKLNVNKVYALIDKENIASISLFEKEHFIKEEKDDKFVFYIENNKDNCNINIDF